MNLAVKWCLRVQNRSSVIKYPCLIFINCDLQNPEMNTLGSLIQLSYFFLEKSNILTLTFTAGSSRGLCEFSAVEMEVLPWVIGYPSGQNALKEHIKQK